MARRRRCVATQLAGSRFPGERVQNTGLLALCPACPMHHQSQAGPEGLCFRFESPALLPRVRPANKLCVCRVEGAPHGHCAIRPSRFASCSRPGLRESVALTPNVCSTTSRSAHDEASACPIFSPFALDRPSFVVRGGVSTKRGPQQPRFAEADWLPAGQGPGDSLTFSSPLSPPRPFRSSDLMPRSGGHSLSRISVSAGNAECAI